MHKHVKICFIFSIVLPFFGMAGETHKIVSEKALAVSSKNEASLTCKHLNLPSPINITQFQAAANLKPLQFDYSAVPLYLLNTGKELQVKFPRTLADEYVRYNNQTYRLTSIDFHFPSEHLVKGRAYPMEIQFIHHNKKQEVLVLTSFVVIGPNHPYIDAILRNLPPATGKAYAPHKLRLNPFGLMPKNKSYYTYQGSLTSPPCTPHVTWIIFQYPVMIGVEQFQLFKQSFLSDNTIRAHRLPSKAVNAYIGNN